jgi:hypothetical protein
VTGVPRVEAQQIPSLPGAAEVMLCPFRLCDWHSDDVSALGQVWRDDLALVHLLDEHRDALTTLGQIARENGLLL